MGNNKIDVHLLFNMEDERHRTAYELFLNQSSPRKRSDFIIDAILAYQNNAEIAKLIASEIMTSGATKKPREPRTTPASGKARTGRPRGRPPKNRPADTTPQPNPSVGLTSAIAEAATPQQPAATTDVDNHDLLKAIQESFG